MAETTARGTSRRTLLAVGAAALLGGGSAAAHPLLRRRGDGAAADGPDLPALPEFGWRSEVGTLTGELVAAPAGAGLAYDGSTPGPLLRVREGDAVRLAFRNATGAPSSLHLHGLPLAPDVDRPLEHVVDGGVSVQEFRVPVGSAGLHWYHPHPHGDVSRQISAGLAGALLVEGAVDEVPALAACEDHVLLVTGGTTTGGALLVNGAERPVLRPARGRTRLRLVSATSEDSLRLGVRLDGAGARFHLAALDGHPLAAPRELAELLLPPGGRAELLVDTSAPGRRELRALPHSPYADGGSPSADALLAALVVPVAREPLPLPAALPAAPPPDVTGAPVRRIVLDGDPGGGFTVGGRSFEMADATGPADVTGRAGTVERWLVVNEHSTDHPFHLHTHPVAALDDPVLGPGVWRDTVPVPAGSAVELAVDLSGPAGRTVFHCHVASHEDMGMMGLVDVLPAGT